MFEILSNRHWLLEEDYLSRMSSLISERLRLGHSIESLVKPQNIEDYAGRITSLLSFIDEEIVNCQLSIVNSEQSGLPVAKSGNKKIAIIPVIGPLTKYSGMCNTGMQGYQSMIAQANADASIDGIVMIMDTPGGTVDGTPEFGLAVKNSAKPIGVFADGMMASAGVWVGSQARVIVANKNNPTAIGSIGTLMVKEDFSTMMESGRHRKAEIIRAPQSTEKALVNSIEPLTTETRGKLMTELKNITDDFITAVKSGRGEKLDATAEGLFAGRMFSAQDAKKMGLIDSLGTLGTAINKVAELSRNKNTTPSPHGEGRGEVNMKFPKLSNLFSGEAWSKVAAVFSEAEQATLEATEQKVADTEAQLTQLTEANTALITQVTEATASVTELTAQVSTLSAENDLLAATVAAQKEELAAKPTGTLTTVVANPKKEEAIAGDNTPKVKSFRTPHDAQVDEYIKASSPNLK